MKRTLIALSIFVILLSFSGCKKAASSSCPWGWSLLSGSSFGITKVTQTTGASVTDVTATILADPCAHYTVSFLGSVETITAASGCSNGDVRSFTATTEGGVDYLSETESGSSVTNKTVVSSSDCASYTTATVSGNITQNVTYTRQ